MSKKHATELQRLVTEALLIPGVTAEMATVRVDECQADEEGFCTYLAEFDFSFMSDDGLIDHSANLFVGWNESAGYGIEYGDGGDLMEISSANLYATLFYNQLPRVD